MSQPHSITALQIKARSLDGSVHFCMTAQGYRIFHKGNLIDCDTKYARAVEQIELLLNDIELDTGKRPEYYDWSRKPITED